MFKDYDKYLSTSLKVYIFVLVIIFILKLVGLDYFGLDIDNPAILKISNFIFNNHLENIWHSITLYVYTYCIVSVSCDIKNIKIKNLIFTLIGIFIKIFESYYGNGLTAALIDIFYLYFICFVTNDKYKIKKLLKRITTVVILTTMYQIISGITRNCGIDGYKYNFIEYIILDFDYLLLCLITIKLYFMERSEKKCITEVGLSLPKKMSLKKSLKELQTNLYKLTKINCMVKEEDNMNYGNYGNYGRGSYGRDEYGREMYGDYDGYGARRRDSRGRYMGHDHIDRMYDDYGRYMESRNRYGANSEDSKRSLQYMLKSMEDFARMLKEEAQSQEEVQMIKQTAQRIAQM